MLTLIFEVTPKKGHADHYFNRAAVLKPLLEDHDGLLHLERYAQVATRNVILSHQYWRDDAAIVGWREDETHNRAQQAGRNVHFDDYRIRVAEVVAHRTNATEISNVMPSIDWGDDRIVVLVESAGEISAPDTMRFGSLVREGAMIAIYTPVNATELRDITQRHHDVAEALTLTRVIRDYSMTSRAEAPQDFEAT